MQFIPIVERLAEAANPDGLVLIGPRDPHPAEVAEWSVDSRQYGVFLCTIFDEWVRKDVGNYYVQLFDVALESWMGLPPSLCVFRPTCGAAMALEHNGDLYSCDHYVDPYMKFMANELRHERPPSHVMSWGRHQEHSAAFVTESPT
jgi:uncharacterized protein